MIQRYAIVGGKARPNPEGGWVLWTDHEATAQRLAKAQAELESERKQSHFTRGVNRKVLDALRARHADAEQARSALTDENAALREELKARYAGGPLAAESNSRS